MKSVFAFTLSLLAASSVFAALPKAGDYGIPKLACGLKVVKADDAKTLYVQGTNNPSNRFLCDDGSVLKFEQSEKNQDVYYAKVGGKGLLVLTVVNEKAFVVRDVLGNDSMFTYAEPTCR